MPRGREGAGGFKEHSPMYQGAGAGRKRVPVVPQGIRMWLVEQRRAVSLLPLPPVLEAWGRERVGVRAGGHEACI